MIGLGPADSPRPRVREKPPLPKAKCRTCGAEVEVLVTPRQALPHRDPVGNYWCYDRFGYEEATEYDAEVEAWQAERVGDLTGL